MDRNVPFVRMSKRNGYIFVFLFNAIAFFLCGCAHDSRHPDVSKINIDLQTRRLDRDLAYIDTSYVGQGLQQLKEVYPDFLDFYLDTLMGFGIHGIYQDSADGIRHHLRPFLCHKDIRGLFDTVAKHFPDTRATDSSLTQGFRYMKYYYPGFTAPKIIYMITGLNQWSVLTVDSTILAVGLDMYLGPHYPFYGAVQIPDYVVRKCRPEYIPVNAFQAIYRNRHPFVVEERTLLDMIVQRGKEQYFLSMILPDAPDSVRFGYTQKQLDWCAANEADIYNFFIIKNLFYETSPQKVLRYVNDGPNSAGMPEGSPGNIGSWLGYRIITAYMERHQGMTMEQLFAFGDAQKLLQESHYKPK